jgi:hypothetical protein
MVGRKGQWGGRDGGAGFTGTITVHSSSGPGGPGHAGPPAGGSSSVEIFPTGRGGRGGTLHLAKCATLGEANSLLALTVELQGLTFPRSLGQSLIGHHLTTFLPASACVRPAAVRLHGKWRWFGGPVASHRNGDLMRGSVPADQLDFQDSDPGAKNH